MGNFPDLLSAKAQLPDPEEEVVDKLRKEIFAPNDDGSVPKGPTSRLLREFNTSSEVEDPPGNDSRRRSGDTGSE